LAIPGQNTLSIDSRWLLPEQSRSVVGSSFHFNAIRVLFLPTQQQ
jgi:hypothetical protein